MNKYLIWIVSTALLVLTLTACSKAQSQKSQLEGTWGIVHYESTTRDAGIQNSYTEDLDPYNPSSRNDGKIAFLNTQGDTFTMTMYGWDTVNKEWDIIGKYSLEYQTGKLYYPQTKRALEIVSLDSRQLVLEMPLYSSADESATITGRTKLVLRKMQDVG